MKQSVSALGYAKPSVAVRSRISLGTVGLLLLVASFFSYKAGFSKHLNQIQELKNEIANLQAENHQLENKQAALEQQWIVLQRNYQVQLEAKKNLSDHLKSLQARNTALAQDMRLYQTVTAQPELAQSVQVKTFQIFPTSTAQTFRYLIVLAKQFSSQEIIEGTIALGILGKVGERSVLLPVQYVDSVPGAGLNFKFRALQELSGELSLPKDFVAHSVQLKIKPGRGWPESEQTFTWKVDILK